MHAILMWLYATNILWQANEQKCNYPIWKRKTTLKRLKEITHMNTKPHCIA